MGREWRDARDRRPHVAVLAVLLGLLTALAGFAPVAIGGYAVISGGVPPEPILEPHVAGDLRIGGTITCAPGTWNDGPREPYEIEIIWTRVKPFERETIEGAKSRTYTVTPADAGWSLRCEERATSWKAWSYNWSWELPVRSPVVRSAPALAGDDRLGGELTCSRGTWDDRGLPAPYAVTYAWKRDGEPIERADSAKHTVVRNDVGHALTCAVTAEGATEAVTGAAYPAGPRDGTPPQIGGDLRVGGLATCSNGTWDGNYALAVEWLRNGDPVATGATYRIDMLDVGSELRCRVTAEEMATAESPPVFPAAPRSRTAPHISGDLRVGGTLTCGTGSWDGDYPLAIQWLRDGAPAETAAQRVNSGTDVGVPFSCTVTAHGVTAHSQIVAPTAPAVRTGPAIDGDARLGRTVTCDTGTWDGNYALTVAWLRDGEPAGTGAQRTIGTADVGHALRCRVTAAGLTTVESRTAFLPAPRSLVAPAISGDPVPGGTLTCGAGVWDGDYALTYRWLRDGAPAGTGPTLTIDAPANTTYSCVVTAAGLTSADSQLVTVAPPAAGNRSKPYITGAPQLGATLTCNPGTWSGASEFTYAWTRGGTGPTRVVGAADLGQTLACEVSAGGAPVASAPVQVTAPVAITAPEIKGSPRLGRTLTCAPGAWDGDYTLTIEWLRDGVKVADGATYVVAGVEPLICRVRAGSSEANSPAVTPVAPVNLVAPAVTGDPRIKGTLTCGSGGWDDSYAITHRWLRDGAPVANVATFTPAAADVGATLRCEAIAGGVAAASRELTVTEPVLRAAPTINGDLHVNGQLTCGRGEWDGDYALTYRWLSNDEEIATGATYTAVMVDAGRPLQCEALAEGLVGAVSVPVEVRSPRNITAPAITGEARIGAALTCTPGSWDATYAYAFRWLRDDAPIGTGATYTVTVADVGKKLGCEVTAEDLTTKAAVPVTARGPHSLGTPVITGDPILRGKLTCSTGTWDGDYALTYRWYRWGYNQPLEGRTGPTIEVTKDDLDTLLQCAVTAEGLTEARSEYLVANRPRGFQSISGLPWVGETLVCEPGAWNDREWGRYQFTYQWFVDDVRSDNAIPGADQPTYTIRPADAGHEVYCMVYGDGYPSPHHANVPVTWEPVTMRLVPDDEDVAAGTPNAYTLTVANPNPVPHVFDLLTVDLPTAFTYVPGSTTGLTTADPQTGVDPDTEPDPETDGVLRQYWQGEFTIPARGEVTLRFRVTGTNELGHYFANAGGGSYQDAAIAVRESSGALIAVESPVQCTIMGTPGDDVLTGTSGDDVICGLGGNDRLFGAAGSDTLLGGDGADVLDGGAGADDMRGGGGLRDTVTYADRTERIVAGKWPDGRDGVPGTDEDEDGEEEIPGEGDNVHPDVEIVRGGRGNDEIYGTPADNELYGGAGDDRLRGGAGDDLLDGGTGADWLDASSLYYQDFDHVFCGPGSDTWEGGGFHVVTGCEAHYVNGG